MSSPHALAPSRSLAAALRTRALWALLRVLSTQQLGRQHFDYSSGLAYAILTGAHEPMVQEALRRTVAPGSVVLDLGAHIGTISLIAASLVNPEGTVISVEPQHECAEAIEAQPTPGRTASPTSA